MNQHVPPKESVWLGGVFFLLVGIGAYLQTDDEQLRLLFILFAIVGFLMCAPLLWRIFRLGRLTAGKENVCPGCDRLEVDGKCRTTSCPFHDAKGT